MSEEKNFFKQQNNASPGSYGEKNQNYIFIKIHIRSTKFNLHGIAILKIQPISNTLETVDAVISPLNRFFESITLDSSWSEHKTYITNKKFVGEFNVNLTSDIINEVSSMASNHGSYQDFIKNIIKSHEKGKNADIIEEIKPAFSRITSDQSIHLIVATEVVSKEEIDMFEKGLQDKDIENKEKASDNYSNKDPFFDVDGALLDCSPAVAPVNGVPIFKIKIGNEIMVKISNHTVQGHKFNEIFNLATVDGRILSKKATVLQIENNNGEYKMVVELSEGIYGKIIETEQIKIKTPQLEELSSENNEPTVIKFFPVLIIIILLILAGFAYIFIF